MLPRLSSQPASSFCALPERRRDHDDCHPFPVQGEGDSPGGTSENATAEGHANRLSPAYYWRGAVPGMRGSFAAAPKTIRLMGDWFRGVDWTAVKSILNSEEVGLRDTRRYCQIRGSVFTTSYHTRFPEYISARTLLPERWTYAAHCAGFTPQLALDMSSKEPRRSLNTIR